MFDISVHLLPFKFHEVHWGHGYGGGQYWFLVTLFGFMILLSLSSLIKNRKLQLAFLTLAFVSVALVPDSSILSKFLNKDHFLFTYPFFILGLMYTEIGYLKKYFFSPLGVGLGTVLFIILLIFFKHQPYVLRYITALCGIYFSYFILFIVKPFPKVRERFVQMGKYTLSIYVLHYFFWGMVPDNYMSLWTEMLLKSNVQALFILVATSLLIIDICIIVTDLLYKSKYTAFILGKTKIKRI